MTTLGQNTIWAKMQNFHKDWGQNNECCIIASKMI